MSSRKNVRWTFYPGSHLLGDKNIKMTAKETQHAASLQFPLGEQAQKAPLFA